VLYLIAPYSFITFNTTLGLGFALSVFLALLVTVLVGVLIEIVIYQPLEKRNSHANVVLISSIGVMIVIINLIALFYGNETKIINRELSGSVTFGDIIITHNQLIQFFVSITTIAVFLVVLKFTKTGITTRALRDNPTLCKIFALNVPKLRIGLFAVSSLFAGIGGFVVAYDVGTDPYVGMPILLNAVVALIIGGIGKFYTPVIGGFFIATLQSLAIWQFSAHWTEAVTFVVLIVFLIFRPQGFFGEKQRLV
jgi:branched-chain amino acid transport system permease protein